MCEQVILNGLIGIYSRTFSESNSTLFNFSEIKEREEMILEKEDVKLADVNEELESILDDIQTLSEALETTNKSVSFILIQMEKKQLEASQVY